MEDGSDSASDSVKYDCSLCGGLDPEVTDTDLYFTPKDLGDSAEAGCPRCSVLHKALSEASEIQSFAKLRLDFDAAPKVNCWHDNSEESEIAGYEFYVSSEDKDPPWSQRIGQGDSEHVRSEILAK
ncbi:hypothetical protein B0J14DRAFT_701364 [Halenospora varia]|nr:hypothetical protein B0J14DRAFT_701364 [Halenospora varia]